MIKVINPKNVFCTSAKGNAKYFYVKTKFRVLIWDREKRDFVSKYMFWYKILYCFKIIVYVISTIILFVNIYFVVKFINSCIGSNYDVN